MHSFIKSSTIQLPLIVFALLLSFTASSQTNTSVPAAVRNRTIVTRYFSAVWNQGQLDVLDELLAARYVNHTPSVPNPPVGPAGLKPIVSALRTAFPDLHYSIQDIITNDSMAVARVIVTGTHTGSLFGQPATGKKFTVNQINIEKIVDGKIVEHWRVTDELSMMKQLGLVF